MANAAGKIIEQFIDWVKGDGRQQLLAAMKHPSSHYAGYSDAEHTIILKDNIDVIDREGIGLCPTRVKSLAKLMDQCSSEGVPVFIASMLRDGSFERELEAEVAAAITKKNEALGAASPMAIEKFNKTMSTPETIVVELPPQP